MDFQLPEIGEGLYEAELVRWLVKPGDPVKRGQVLMELMTDKATMEVPAAFAGTVTELRAEPGAVVKVGQVVLTYQPAGAAAPQPAPVAARETDARQKVSAAPPAAAPQARTVNGPQVATGAGALPVKAAPSVRYMARKLGIDLTQVRGTGPQGRVLIEDLTTHVKPAGDDKRERPAEPRPDYGTPGTRVKLAGIRRKVAEHMVQSKHAIPHYTLMDECDVTELVRLREGLREAVGKSGVKVTYLHFFVKAVANALKEVPIVNSTLDDAAGEIVLHDRYDVGVAVAAPGGLLVPVVRGADRKDVFQIAREVERLSTEARAGRAKREDLVGSTFTITSIGGFGGLFATPIINHPEVAILGIGKVVKRPVFDAAGNVRPADLLYLSLSFDHRVVDGAIGAAFCNAVMRQIQNPVALLVSSQTEPRR
jgi:pyruvate dehydrogenase E2 component (dihydrolipoamide acetyltransferase)/2-oxoisovalerate dehydrogenase E2 component (dihydrolipoyl transacylase)